MKSRKKNSETIIILLLFVIIGGFIPHQPLPGNRPLALVRNFKPQVVVIDGRQVITLKPTEDKLKQLFSGDTLRTGNDGFAAVLFMDKSTAKVKPNSTLIIRGDIENTRPILNSRIDLERGEVFLEVIPGGAKTFEISTNKSVAVVKGTEFGTRDDGYYWVQEGLVDVTATESGETQSISRGMFAQVNEEGNSIKTGQLSDVELKNLNSGFDELTVEMVQKTVILRFRDANGQLREERITIFEKQN